MRLLIVTLMSLAASASGYAQTVLRFPRDSVSPDSIYKAQLARFKKQYRTSFVASGAVQSSLGTGASTTPVSGALGISHDTPKEHFVALIAVAGNGDTLVSKNKRDFANAVLSPGINGTGKNSGVIVDYLRFVSKEICYPGVQLPPLPDSAKDAAYEKDRAKFGPDALKFAKCQAILEAKRKNGLALDNRWGVRSYLSLSKSNWRTTAPLDSGGSNSDVNLLAFGLHGVWIPLNHPLDEKENSFQFRIEAGLSVRGVLGDIAAPTESDARAGYLGTEAKWFSGIELAPTIQLNRVSAYSAITCLGSSHHGDHIPGLTGVQVVLGFSFDAPLFTF